MPLRTLLLIVLCLSFACVGRAVSAAAADSPPTADEVEQFIATTLPGYWKVDQLSLSDPVDYGNPIEPEWRWRYEALIAPSPAPTATGWSDSCRAGFAPAEGRRLRTAHGKDGLHWVIRFRG